MREISLREIADTSKISLRYLEALEENRFEVLPAIVFARGFLREYAKYVGLDPDEVVNYFMLAQQEVEEEVAERPRRSGHSSRHWAMGLLITLGVLMLFGAVAWLSFRAERREPVAETPPPMAAPLYPEVGETQSAQTSTAPLLVTIDFLSDTNVHAVIDDEQRIAELRVQGESMRLEAQRSVVLSIDDVRGVVVEVNGIRRELPSGPDGRVDEYAIVDETPEPQP